MPRNAGDRLNVRRWLPPLVWAGVIIFATSMPSELVPAQVSSFDKVAHFGMYAILAWLLARHGTEVAGRWVAMVLAIIVASGFGAVDEWHQQYIPGRSTELADWQADTLGAAVGALVYAVFSRRRTGLTSPE
jgi:VanZ family protein